MAEKNSLHRVNQKWGKTRKIAWGKDPTNLESATASGTNMRSASTSDIFFDPDFSFPKILP